MEKTLRDLLKESKFEDKEGREYKIINFSAVDCLVTITKRYEDNLSEQEEYFSAILYDKLVNK